jgi:hypothetical protein
MNAFIFFFKKPGLDFIKNNLIISLYLLEMLILVTILQIMLFNLQY